MTDIMGSNAAFAGAAAIRPRRLSPEQVRARTKKRYASERRFKLVGLAAVVTAIGLLGILLTTIVAQGYSAFWQTVVTLPVELPREKIDPEQTGERGVIGKADYRGIVRDAVFGYFPEVEERRELRALNNLVSNGASLDLRGQVIKNPDLIGQTIEVQMLASDDIDQFVKGHIDRDLPEGDRLVKDNQIAWIDRLESEGRIDTVFNTWLLTNGDSREPEMAGIWGAVVGSFYMMVVVLLLSVPLGVGAAIYLEEFAPKNNRWVDLIEVNVNNLAAVPSIVFGLLGLAVFINVAGLPRSAPIVGGLTLTLMTLPTIVVATRAALRAVPPSIREGALGVGASNIQVVAHHVLPLATPGILTGTIIGLAQALGETAPLLMIGMIAFIVNVPSGPFDPSTALPVQIFLWADSPERAFTERSAAAIMVLLGFLIAMNTLAVILRQRLQRKW